MQTASLAIVCIGQALIVTTGEFDLSLGQNVCLTSAVMAYLIKFAGFNPWIAILCPGDRRAGGTDQWDADRVRRHPLVSL